MCDEARIHKEEQLSICVRYAVEMEVYERFLGFVDVSKGQNANNIVEAIYAYFEGQKISIQNVNIVAQSYDGASVMSGNMNGVQAKIKEQHPAAVYTHCMAHRLNLVVVDTCKSIKSAQAAFNILEAVYVHLSRPSKNTKLIEIQKKMGLSKSTTVIWVCDTRWVCRYKNCESIINNFESIVKALKEEVEDQADKDVAQAIGILSSITKKNFIVIIFILYDVLCIINILSNQLQNKKATLGNSGKIIKGVIASFKHLRSDEAFDKFWQKVQDFANKNNILLTILSTNEVSKEKQTRKRREPAKLQDYALSHRTGAESENNTSNTIEYWRTTVYLRIIDAIIINLEKRFSEESLELAESVDNFFNLDEQNSLCFINTYKVLKKC
ncbi:zinc finger MYM-type protein 1-like [Metopolophium dirhodum]|uniref:zinc finger MYM-type protein 1-like n=1 Tax=Metopolophium dirhodum TaxID=44670 RepID=UPI00298F4D6E|nr:zinc finger MYM-type protein 1-like [Metopolophium dirhodum]